MPLFFPYAPGLPHTDTLLNLHFFFGQLPTHSPLLRLERQSKRFYCLSRSECLEVGDEWGHQLNKPSMLSCCPHHPSAFNARYSCTTTEHEHIHWHKLLNIWCASSTSKLYIQFILYTCICGHMHKALHMHTLFMILMMRRFLFCRYTKKKC